MEATTNNVCSHSVNALIQDLCINLMSEKSKQNPTAKQLKRLKRKSYEILLKHRKGHNKYAEDFDAMRELRMDIFAARLQAQTTSEICRIDELERQLEQLFQQPVLQNDTGRAMLQLMMLLQTSIGKSEPTEQEHFAITMRRQHYAALPGVFSMFAKGTKIKKCAASDELTTYHHGHIDWLTAKPRFFKLPTSELRDASVNADCFGLKYIFTQQIKMSSSSNANMDFFHRRHDECRFTYITKQIWNNNATMRINMTSLQVGSVSTNDEKSNMCQTPTCASSSSILSETSSCKDVAEVEATEERIAVCAWDSLNCKTGSLRHKPFVSDSSVSLDLKILQANSIAAPFQAKIVTQKRFLRDLKLLTVGIQSNTFQHDHLLVFSMTPNITVQHVLPATIANYVDEFLECGGCFKRLQNLIKKHNFKHLYDGFIFKAMCSAIDEYLLSFQQIVFAPVEEHLIGFYARISVMMSQIRNLCHMLFMQPAAAAGCLLGRPPLGSQFLAHIYREIMRITEQHYISLLIFILKRCCHVYFKHLHKWFFHGILDDPSNELFINFVDQYRPQTKHFYDKAYVLRKEAVPGFFQGYEEQMLQCGKYTMLLKAYKPKHPIFTLYYPDMSVCLTFDEIEKLTSTVADYKMRARKACGPAYSIRERFQQKAEEQQQFMQRVGESARANLLKWTVNQQIKKSEAAAHKSKLLSELQANLEEVRLRKIAEKRANVELELKALQTMKKNDEQLLLQDNINLRKRIEYYQEQSKLLNMESDANTAKLTIQITKPNKEVALIATPEFHTNDPTTPGSTCTEYESCLGDTDFEECLSEEFLLSFDDTEKTLVASTTSLPKEEEEENQLNAKQVQLQVLELKRTASDVINSNEIAEMKENVATHDVDDDHALKTNRNKMMSSAAMHQIFEEKTSANIISTSRRRALTPPAIFRTEDITPTKQMITIAQREAEMNRLKVLSQEFGITQRHELTQSLPDINRNCIQQTELQRNRQRMMNKDIFIAAEQNERRAELNLNLETDMQRNRRKCMLSEYNLQLSEQQAKFDSKKQLELCEVNTPMSTTSDTTITEQEATQAQDLVNGNLVTTAAAALKINVELAANANNDQVVVEETPASALNTAGLLRKVGFEFERDEELLKQKQLQDIAAIPLKTCAEDEDEQQNTTYNSYEWCNKLVESNFRCPTRSGLLRLNQNEPNVVDINEVGAKVQTELSSVCVVTLTDFLKKSVIWPMQAHLELVQNEVLRMFLEDLQILKHFSSLRNFYFLLDGEFAEIICDGIIGKMEHGIWPSKLYNFQMLHAILDDALAHSMMGNDKNALNLSFIVSDVPDCFDRSSPDVLRHLSLSYSVNWPLNLILNESTMEKYASIFKYLLKVRRISWTLEHCFTQLNMLAKQHGNAVLCSPQFRHVQLIRNKLYQFVHALQHHIAGNALQASWKTFQDELQQVHSFEELYRKHAGYIKRILFLCLLNKSSLDFNSSIENIFKICLRFYYNLKSREFKKSSSSEPQHFTHARYNKMCGNEKDFDKQIKYTIHLAEKIVRRGYQDEIAQLIILINFNNHYTTAN